MSTVKLQSSNTFNNFANDVESMPSSPNSPCSVFIDTGNDFRLGPYDLHESWPKMSGGASPSSALPKKKKKSDAKPQSQINKCLNEKRRREQENIYIEELAELISASFADMSSLSVKPDKCAILQETVKQNRRIKPENSESLVGIESAVQQGEVSSSKQSKISNTELAPLLLSALEGFLLVVSADGRIEFVSDNIEQFLNYNQEELIGESVYNFIHHGDHNRFGVLLNKLLLYGSSIVSPGSTQSSASPMDHPPSGSKSNNWNHRRFTTKFNCRLLVKPQSDQDQTIEEKQTRVCQYKTLQISSTKINGGMLDDEENTEGGGQSLLCIAQHALNEKHLSQPLEQFTFKLDQNGKILSLDTQNVSNTYAQYMNKENLVGRMLHEQCHKNDSLKVINHIKETRRTGSSTSPIYKLHLVDEKYINVQTKSKYFMKTDDEMEFIMAIISIIGDSEMCTMIENHSSALAAASAAVAAVTDPLGVVSLNGTDSLSMLVSGPGSNHSGSNMQSETKFSATNAFNMTPTSDLNFSDFPLFQSTAFSDILQENKWSEQSMSVVETLTKTTPVPSPATISSNPHTPTAHTPYNTSFPFSPLIPSPKDSFDSIDKTESARLRTLLMTTKRADGSFEESKHNILKGLLNQPEIGLQDEESMNHHSTPPSPANSRPQSHNSSNLNDTPAALNNTSSNNMLLKLLNDKSEDEDLEARVGIKKQNELLQQLLKEDDNVRQHGAILEQNEQQHSNEEHILNDFQILPPTSPDSLGHSHKRKSVSADDENDHPPLKRSLIPSVLESIPNPSISSQPQVPTNSKLRERNKMLASLLAKDPPPTAIPAIPASVISATPQDKLVNIIKQQQQQQQQQSAAGSWNSNQHSMTIPQQRMPLNQIQVHQRGLPPKSANNIFLNHMLDQQPQSLNSPGQLSNMQMSQMRIVTSAVSSLSGGYNHFNNPDSNINLQSFNSDPELSELLEEVMDIMVVTSESTNAANTVVGSNAANQSSFNSLMNEKMAVSEIQKCLMQVESTVKSPAQLNYGSPTGNSVQAQNQFIPPPAYQPQQKTSVRFNQQQSPRLSGVASYPKNQQQQLLLHQQQKQRLIQQQQQQQQQQQKQRLLQQQQQQKMVVSSNSAAISTQDPTTALQTIDSLLNNSVAPNVALQLSSNVPDSQSQLSPVYAASGSQLLNSSQISPSSNRQPPYSNLTQQQSFSMLNYGTTTQTQTTAQSQQQVPQQAITRMSSSSHSQYQNSINPCVNQQPQTQSVYINQTQQPGVWTQQQRLTLHQQQNPMLNAQLQVTGFNNGSSPVRQNFINTQQQPQQQGRVLTSPVSYTTEVPANNNCSPQQQQLQQQQQHQLQFRMPRSVSISTPTNVQIPGGNNSVTEFTRNELRAFVGVRSQQQGGNARLTGQLLSGQNITPTELDPLSLNFDMSPTGGSESPKWSGLNSDLGASSPQSQGMASRAPVDDSNRTNNTNSTTSVSATDQKSSLLQKLLSE